MHWNNSLGAKRPEVSIVQRFCVRGPEVPNKTSGNFERGDSKDNNRSIYNGSNYHLYLEFTFIKSLKTWITNL